MKAISGTGLIASPKKEIKRYYKHYDFSVTREAISQPAAFSLRQFGGLYNPFFKGCSILCNHPAPQDIKEVVKQAKELRLSESQRNKETIERDIYPLNDISEHIPEEFFRRFTDTDSRPMTPTPSVISGRTRISTASQLQATRRCVTPEPSFSFQKERKQIIVDLRRSHSQETLFWNASSELSSTQRSQQKLGVIQPTKSPVRFGSGDDRSKSAEKRSFRENAENLTEGIESIEPLPITCIHAMDHMDDVPRRRGKKKKKTKNSSTFSATFTLAEEPETQIAKLGPDSINPSARPSLIPNSSNLPRFSLLESELNYGTYGDPSGSYLNDELLKILSRGLDISRIEHAFHKDFNYALKEAYRMIPIDKKRTDSQALIDFKQSIEVETDDIERWIGVPRRFTRSAARFEIPVNSRELEVLTPIDYLKKYVTVTSYRKQLYDKMFDRFIPKPDEETETNSDAKKPKNVSQESPSPNGNIEEYQERVITIDCLDQAMKDTLGFHGTQEKIDEIKDIVKLNEVNLTEINFRLWCGLLAFSERYLVTTKRDVDPPDILEITDFESMERKYQYISVNESLKCVLELIKYR